MAPELFEAVPDYKLAYIFQDPLAKEFHAAFAQNLTSVNIL